MIIKPWMAVQTAFIAIASRLVGATFRVVETRSPELQKKNLVSDPQVVLQREALTISLAWIFALATNIAVTPLAVKRRWSKNGMTFITSFIGALAAETIGRIVAYRKVAAAEKKAAAAHPAVKKVINPTPAQPHPEAPARQAYSQMPTMPFPAWGPAWQNANYGSYPPSCYPTYPTYGYWSGY